MAADSIDRKFTTSNRIKRGVKTRLIHKLAQRKHVTAMIQLIHLDYSVFAGYFGFFDYFGYFGYFAYFDYNDQIQNLERFRISP